MELLARSSRDKRPPSVFTPTREVKPYELNKGRALAKKIDASNRDFDVEIELKRGTLVLEFSAAAYEIFKEAIFYYYDNCKSKAIKVNQSQDSKRGENITIVEESISVRFATGGGQIYRVNLHHTTSRVTVNGRTFGEFLNNDLGKVLSYLDNRIDFRELNLKIRNACGKALVGCNNKPAVGRNTSTKQFVVAQTTSPDVRSPDGKKCSTCKRNCITRAAKCVVCDKWVHYRCEKLTVLQIAQIEPASYECSTCSEEAGKEVASLGELLRPQSPRTLPHCASLNRNQAVLLPLPYDNCSISNEGDVTCRACQQQAITNIIQCVECQEWFHAQCTGVTTPLPDDFVCKLCKGEAGMSTATASVREEERPTAVNRCINTAKIVQAKGKKPTPNNAVLSTNSTSTTEHSKLTSFVGDREKELNQRERALNTREKKIKQEERELQDTAKQLATAQAYIINLEQDINDLRDTNRILRLRVTTPQPAETTQKNSNTTQSQHHEHVNQNDLLGRMSQRITDLEIQSLKNRIDSIELTNKQHQQPQNVNIYPPSTMLPPPPPWCSPPPPRAQEPPARNDRQTYHQRGSQPPPMQEPPARDDRQTCYQRGSQPPPMQAPPARNDRQTYYQRGSRPPPMQEPPARNGRQPPYQRPQTNHEDNATRQEQHIEPAIAAWAAAVNMKEKRKLVTYDDVIYTEDEHMENVKQNPRLRPSMSEDPNQGNKHFLELRPEAQEPT
jgi:hypothetical protein